MVVVCADAFLSCVTTGGGSVLAAVERGVQKVDGLL
jgi:hypothetical protein